MIPLSFTLRLSGPVAAGQLTFTPPGLNSQFFPSHGALIPPRTEPVPLG